jgi:hypothetical protein
MSSSSRGGVAISGHLSPEREIGSGSARNQGVSCQYPFGAFQVPRSFVELRAGSPVPESDLCCCCSLLICMLLHGVVDKGMRTSFVGASCVSMFMMAFAAASC